MQRRPLTKCHTHLYNVYDCFGEGNGNPLQCSCLENIRDRGAWWAAVHGVAKSGTRLSDFSFTFLFPALEKEMATHSSVLTWRIPGTREPGGLPSMALQSRTRLKRLSSSSSSSLLLDLPECIVFHIYFLQVLTTSLVKQGQ